MKKNGAVGKTGRGSNNAVDLQESQIRRIFHAEAGCASSALLIQ